MPVPFYHEPMGAAHRHFWGVNRLQYPWVPAGESPLRCNIRFRRYNGTKMAEPIILIDADILNGTPCFRGTRVPFKNLIDYLEGGHSLGEFLRQFPTVTRDMAIQALEEAKESLLASIA